MTSQADFSVIIPAHNEEAVIARLLEGLVEGLPDDVRPELVIAANGCSDRTVEQARKVAPWAKVVELSTGSKTRAINEANRLATRSARIVLDADVECNFETLEALAAEVRKPGVMIAAPEIRLDLTRCNALAAAYYRAWKEQPYAKQGKGGAGCYALSLEAMDAIGEFPDVISDDIWVHTRFPDEQRRLVSRDLCGRPAFTLVHPPRSAHEQIRVEARRQNGNMQVRHDHPSPYMVQSGGSGGIKSALSGPAAKSDVAIFFAMKLCARVLASWNKMTGRAGRWSRDLGSRQA